MSTPVIAVDNCIQDVWWAHGNTQKLQCTANDVTISTIDKIEISAGGMCDAKGCVCYEGGDVTFSADFTMPLTADERYDIGFYIATDGDQSIKGALTGECSSTNVSSANSTTFINDDPPPDVCGDIKGPLNTLYNPQVVRHTVTMPCKPNKNGKLAIPYCTTWRQPGSNEVCLGTGTSNATNDVFPGAPSKCYCGLKELDIFTETADIKLTKACTNGPILETGGAATYGVTIKNLAQVAKITLTGLTDDKYGDITYVHGDITDTTCTEKEISAGVEISCTFTANVPAGDVPGEYTDTLTVAWSDNFGHTGSKTASASCKYTDVPEPPKLNKSVSACGSVQTSMVVTYSVVVTNTSPTPPGDILTLSELSDDRFDDITTTHGAYASYEAVLSTNCGLATSSGGPGSLPIDIMPGDTYACQFQGVVTGSSDTYTHKNTVTGTAKDDDGVDYYPFDDASVGVKIEKTGCP